MRPGLGCSYCFMCFSRLISCVAASWVSELVIEGVSSGCLEGGWGDDRCSE